MSSSPRSAEMVGELALSDIGWHLRVYLMRSDPAENVDCGVLFSDLAEKVGNIERDYLSAEFSYIRSGFAIAHYGRRGVTYTIWHWADWNGTWECFSHAWYCYCRKIAKMEPLDRSEPAFCHHELKVVVAEGHAFLTITSHQKSMEEVVRQYRAAHIMVPSDLDGDKISRGTTATK